MPFCYGCVNSVSLFLVPRYRPVKGKIVSMLGSTGSDTPTTPFPCGKSKPLSLIHKMIPKQQNVL